MRSWDRTQKATQYYPESPDKEAAKWLRLAAGRYANGRATLDEIREAFAALVDADPNSASRQWHYITEKLPEQGARVRCWRRLSRLGERFDADQIMCSFDPHVFADRPWRIDSDSWYGIASGTEPGQIYAWELQPVPPPLPGGPDA